MNKVFVPFGVLAAALAHAQLPTFRAEVKLVRLLATVTDETGQLVGSLPKEKFRVWDSGEPQEISVFERSTELPLSVALLLDTSGSTAKDLPLEVESVRRFLRALLHEGNSKDATALYAFNYQTIQLCPFTRRQGRIDKALKALKGEAGTSLYDAIHFAAGDLELREGRKVIVVVTDGGDTTSVKSFRDALKGTHLAEAAVYPILIQPVKNEAGRNIGGENALSSLARGTGGKVYQASLGQALDRVFEQLLADLRTQYLLGYYPKRVPSTHGFHEVRVEILEDGQPTTKLRVSARSGYYEDSLNRAPK